MVEPITIMIAVSSLFSLLSSGMDWFKKRRDAQSITPDPLSLAVQTYPTAIPPSPSHEDISIFEYEGSKHKKKALSKRESSSNSGFSIGLVLVIVLVLAVMAFIVYWKWNKLKENEFRFRQSEKQFDSPLSPPTTQADYDLLSV